jgi:FMN phosphatase YigB (HAD superfamily)
MKRINPVSGKNHARPPIAAPAILYPEKIQRLSSGSGSWHNSTKDSGIGKRLPDKVVFLLDVDNTLLDNDAVEASLKQHLTKEFGIENCDRYWSLLEELRTELGYADYLGALQRYRLQDLSDPRLLLMSSFLVDYPFADRLYPGALDVIRHLNRWGPTVILSDGDAVFQPRKAQRSGLWDAVEGRVLIYIHKEKMLEDVMRRYPARHYIMVDDKLSILTAIKEILGDRLTSIFPRQGHYANDPKSIAAYPTADITIKAISDLVEYQLPTLLGNAAADAVMQQEQP